VDNPQDAPIFVSLDRVCRCPKEIPDGETSSEKRGNKERKTRRMQEPESEPEPISDPETRNSQGPGPWSTWLQPRQSAGKDVLDMSRERCNSPDTILI